MAGGLGRAGRTARGAWIRCCYLWQSTPNLRKTSCFLRGLPQTHQPFLAVFTPHPKPMKIRSPGGTSVADSLTLPSLAVFLSWETTQTARNRAAENMTPPPHGLKGRDIYMVGVLVGVLWTPRRTHLAPSDGGQASDDALVHELARPVLSSPPTFSCLSPACLSPAVASVPAGRHCWGIWWIWWIWWAYWAWWTRCAREGTPTAGKTKTKQKQHTKRTAQQRQAVGELARNITKHRTKNCAKQTNQSIYVIFAKRWFGSSRSGRGLMVTLPVIGKTWARTPLMRI